MSFMDRPIERLIEGQRRVVVRLLRVLEWMARHPVLTMGMVGGVISGPLKRRAAHRRPRPQDAQRYASSGVRRMRPVELRRYAAVLALATLALELLRLPLHPAGSRLRSGIWIALHVTGAVLTVWIARWLHGAIELWTKTPEDQREAVFQHKVAEWMRERGIEVNEEEVSTESASAPDGDGRFQ